MNKPANKTNETQECLKISSFEIIRANYIEKAKKCFFDMEVNGIKVYGMAVVEGKNGDFISWPQKKGSDEKYYSICWARLSDEDEKKIIKAVEKKLNS